VFGSKAGIPPAARSSHSEVFKPKMHFVLKLSKLCNLRCTYCYEYDELAVKDRMPREGLEFFIAGAVADFALPATRAWIAALGISLRFPRRRTSASSRRVSCRG